MLNFVRHYLNDMEHGRRLLIVSYNPWWFSGHEDLVKAFFGQLRAQLGERKGLPPKVANKLTDLAEALSEVRLAAHVREFDKGNALSDRQRRAVSQFLREYEFRRQGGNPDDPFAQERMRKL